MIFRKRSLQEVSKKHIKGDGSGVNRLEGIGALNSDGFLQNGGFEDSGMTLLHNCHHLIVDRDTRLPL